MARLSLALSLLASVLSGVAAWLAWTAPRRGAPDAGDVSALETRLARLERAAPPPVEARAGSPADAGTAPTLSAALPAGPSPATLSGAAARAPSLPDLERRLAEVERAVRASPHAPLPAPMPVPAGPQTADAPAVVSFPTFYGSVDDAQKDLGLTPAQRD